MLLTQGGSCQPNKLLHPPPPPLIITFDLATSYPASDRSLPYDPKSQCVILYRVLKIFVLIMKLRLTGCRLPDPCVCLKLFETYFCENLLRKSSIPSKISNILWKIQIQLCTGFSVVVNYYMYIVLYNHISS